MELTNATPLAVELKAGAPHGLRFSERLGLIAAKATFRVEPGGAVRLDGDAPLPCFVKDEETELGLLPQDDLVRWDDDVFEVVLLGAAYAPGGRPAPEVVVTMSLGSITRRLVVIGERSWPAGPANVTPFERLPMTWERAYGGQCDVEIDRGAIVQLGEPLNPAGVGFDPEPGAKQLAEHLGCPPGYPIVPPALRLPNLERPEARIQQRSDAPPPTCWATLPMQSGIHALRIAAEQERRRLPPEAVDDNPVAFHRAHPDWVIPMPQRAAAFLLENATPEGRLAFTLPELRVLCDFARGSAVSTFELMPQRLVMLPEERCFTLSYGRTFRYPYLPGEPRSLRLRTERGWYRPEARPLLPEVS